MFCRYCGNQIDNDSLYCRFCGRELQINRLGWIPLVSNSPKETSESSVSSPVSKANKSSKKTQIAFKKKLPTVVWATIFFTCLILYLLVFPVKIEYTDSISLYVPFIIEGGGLVGFWLSYLLRQFILRDEIPVNRLKRLTGGESAGGMINLIGFTYKDTERTIQYDNSDILKSNFDFTRMSTTVKYLFFVIFQIPIFPVQCHLVYVPHMDNSPTCRIYANCKWNIWEILEIYFFNWSWVAIVIGTLWILNLLF